MIEPTLHQLRHEELVKEMRRFVNCTMGTTRDGAMWIAGAEFADKNPSVEMMLNLFWFFDKHGLIANDLCFDPQHFMETVAKEHFPNFDYKTDRNK